VRGSAPIVPLRTPLQLPQLQFHCGKPPPAEEPRTLIFIPLSAVRCVFNQMQTSYLSR
jgi:hypothetical protein